MEKFYALILLFSPPVALTSESDTLNGPWPDVVIASGRKAIAPALWIKKQSGNKTKLIVIQSPVIKNSDFDMVIVAPHDRYTHPRAISMMGALSIITPEKLATAKEEWRNCLEKIPDPALAIMIGGDSRTHKMTRNITEKLASQLQDLAQNYSLMITASRRTPEEQQQLLRDTVKGPNIFF